MHEARRLTGRRLLDARRLPFRSIVCTLQRSSWLWCGESNGKLCIWYAEKFIRNWTTRRWSLLRSNNGRTGKDNGGVSFLVGFNWEALTYFQEKS